MCASDTGHQVSDRQVNDRRRTTPTVILRWVWNAWVPTGCILSPELLQNMSAGKRRGDAPREQNLKRAETIGQARTSNQPLDSEVCRGDVSKGKGICRVRLRNDWIAQPASF